MSRKKLLLVTTVPDTFSTILRGQPRFLGQFFDLVVVSSDGYRLNDFALSEGVDSLSVPMVRGINPFADIVSIFKMIRVIAQIKPDVIHSYTPKAGLVAMVSAWLCRVPARVHTFTGLIFPTQTGFKKRLLIWVDRLICACATKIVPEGAGVLADLKSYRITDKPLSVIGFGNIAGVDTRYFARDAEGVLLKAQELRTQIGRPGFIYCFVGRLNRDKGVRELVQAFSSLHGDVALLLVGGDDPEAPIDMDTRLLIESASNIHALGFMSDIRPALAASDVLVLPSYREGFPNVVLQAGAMELPVIASNISGCNEAVTPGYNGWLVPAKDVGSLADAMTQALEGSANELKIMGNNARQRVLERFERAEHWARMKSFYEGLPC